MRPDERACGSLSAPAGAEAGTQDAAGGELRRTCLTTPCRPRMDDAGAGAAVFGAVAPANAQIRAGAKRPTPKKLGSDRMPAQNFAPVVSPLSAQLRREQECLRRNPFCAEACMHVLQNARRMGDTAGAAPSVP